MDPAERHLDRQGCRPSGGDLHAARLLEAERRVDDRDLVPPGRQRNPAALQDAERGLALAQLDVERRLDVEPARRRHGRPGAGRPVPHDRRARPCPERHALVHPRARRDIDGQRPPDAAAAQLDRVETRLERDLCGRHAAVLAVHEHLRPGGNRLDRERAGRGRRGGQRQAPAREGHRKRREHDEAGGRRERPAPGPPGARRRGRRDDAQVGTRRRRAGLDATRHPQGRGWRRRRRESEGHRDGRRRGRRGRDRRWRGHAVGRREPDPLRPPGLASDGLPRRPRREDAARGGLVDLPGWRPRQRRVRIGHRRERVPRVDLQGAGHPVRHEGRRRTAAQHPQIHHLACQRGHATRILVVADRPREQERQRNHADGSDVRALVEAHGTRRRRDRDPELPPQLAARQVEPLQGGAEDRVGHHEAAVGRDDEPLGRERAVGQPGRVAAERVDRRHELPQHGHGHTRRRVELARGGPRQQARQPRAVRPLRQHVDRPRRAGDRADAMHPHERRVGERGEGGGALAQRRLEGGARLELGTHPEHFEPPSLGIGHGQAISETIAEHGRIGGKRLTHNRRLQESRTEGGADARLQPPDQPAACGTIDLTDMCSVVYVDQSPALRTRALTTTVAGLADL